MRLGNQFVTHAVDTSSLCYDATSGEQMFRVAAVAAKFLAELPASIERVSLYSMSTVLEIENVVEKLPAEKLAEFAAWFEDYQTMVSSSAEVFAMYDREEVLVG